MVKVNTADCPGVTVALVGFEAMVKVAISTWKVWLTGKAAA
jgi:hypothetical protein